MIHGGEAEEEARAPHTTPVVKRTFEHEAQTTRVQFFFPHLQNLKDRFIYSNQAAAQNTKPIFDRDRNVLLLGCSFSASSCT